MGDFKAILELFSCILSRKSVSFKIPMTFEPEEVKPNLANLKDFWEWELINYLSCFLETMFSGIELC